MATLDFSKASASIDMTDPGLVGFGTVDEATPTEWSFLTPGANKLELLGQDLTYDAQGHALSGTVSSISIDVGLVSSAFLEIPQVRDLVITGINVAAPTLDDGAGSFWRFLEGNDVFTLPVAPSLGTGPSFSIFGDTFRVNAGSTSGGDDLILANGAQAYIAGDAMRVGRADGASTAVLLGGADRIQGEATGTQQVMIGDAASVLARAKLTGGNDDIRIRSTDLESLAVGDVEVVKGSSAHRAEVIGGNDYIEAGAGSRARLVGDVDEQLGNSLVRGGNDELAGADQSEFILGDVYDVGNDRLFGGNDTIWGNGGGDLLIGDAYAVALSGRVIGGNDVIYGGEDDDFIYGDTGNGGPTDVTGGNDELHGDAGNDLIIGGGGDDVLDGGSGNDNMFGEAGNDTYVVDSSSDAVHEEAGQGIDTVKALVAAITLADNVENLSSLWIGDFSGFGNGLNNLMSAGGGEDLLIGKAGNDTLVGLSGKDALFGNEDNDTLIGGADADLLDGGDGVDTASYAGATEGVKAALDGSFVGEGDALGDTFASVERLVGSEYRDVLRGDAGANLLAGGGGNDKLQGGGGNDTIVGGAGRDELIGGAGNDRFDYLALTDGGDTVADFGNAAGNNDTLRFDGEAFGGLSAGALAASRFAANAAGVATMAGQRFVYETDTGILRYDANGSAAGGVTVIATFSGAPTVSASDIVII